jgi:hypothetical protein
VIEKKLLSFRVRTVLVLRNDQFRAEPARLAPLWMAKTAFAVVLVQAFEQLMAVVQVRTP